MQRTPLCGGAGATNTAVWWGWCYEHRCVVGLVLRTLLCGGAGNYEHRCGAVGYYHRYVVELVTNNNIP